MDMKKQFLIMFHSETLIELNLHNKFDLPNPSKSTNYFLYQELKLLSLEQSLRFDPLCNRHPVCYQVASRKK